MKNKFLALLLTLSTVAVCYGETPKVTFKSRGLFDSAVSGYDKSKGTQFLYSITDLRAGVKVDFGAAELKADVSFGAKKVAIKDLLFNYHFENSFISVGNGYEPFSLEMLESTLDVSFSQAASSAAAFGDSRKLGVSYHMSLPQLYFATGVYSNNDINTIYEDRSDAVVSTSRLVYRHVYDSEKMFQVGGAFSYRSAEPTVDGVPPVREIASSGLTTLFGEDVVNYLLDDAGAESKGVFEAVAMFPKWRVKAEYYLNRQLINNSDKIYTPHGGYAQVGVLLLGKGYKYDQTYALPGRPLSARAVELAFRYNTVDLNDSKSGIYGGEQQDVSVGVNYYHNKYFGIKLSGGYMFVGDNCNPFYDRNMFIGQLRLQFTI